MEVTRSSEVYAEYQWTTRHYIPKDRALNFRSKGNSLKWCIPYALFDERHHLIIWYDFLNITIFPLLQTDMASLTKGKKGNIHIRGI
jgi:hypothetical protein